MPINVREAVTLHAVAQDECGAPRVRLDDLHAHGLAERGHPEFQAFATACCVGPVCQLLCRHADRVLNGGGVFQDGELAGGDAGDEWVYELTVNDDGDPILRLSDPGSRCDERSGHGWRSPNVARALCELRL